MKKLLHAIAYIAVMGVFLGGGLWLGPRIHSLYNFLFPEPAFVTGDYSALYTETSKPVVIFTSSTCPHCQHARDLLAKEKADYYDFVIDQSPEAMLRYKELHENAVPVLFIGDRKIVGARDEAIQESLHRILRN